MKLNVKIILRKMTKIFSGNQTLENNLAMENIFVKNDIRHYQTHPQMY